MLLCGCFVSFLTHFKLFFSSLAVLITFCKWLNTQNPEIEIRFHKKTRRFGLRLTTRILLVDLLVVWSDRILHYFTFCTTLEIQYTNSINLVRVTCSRKKRVLVVLLEFDSIYASIYQANNIIFFWFIILFYINSDILGIDFLQLFLHIYNFGHFCILASCIFVDCVGCSWAPSLKIITKTLTLVGVVSMLHQAVWFHLLDSFLKCPTDCDRSSCDSFPLNVL